METTIINTTPAGLRDLLAFCREPYGSSSEEQVSFEDIFRTRRLAGILGVPTDYLLGRTDKREVNR